MENDDKFIVEHSSNKIPLIDLGDVLTVEHRRDFIEELFGDILNKTIGQELCEESNDNHL